MPFPQKRCALFAAHFSVRRVWYIYERIWIESGTIVNYCLFRRNIIILNLLRIFFRKVISVVGVLCTCMEDYTTDHRGDVGSWVRLAAMDAIDKCVSVWHNSIEVFTVDFLSLLFTLLHFLQFIIAVFDTVRYG